MLRTPIFAAGKKITGLFTGII